MYGVSTTGKSDHTLFNHH